MTNQAEENVEATLMRPPMAEVSLQHAQKKVPFQPSAFLG